MSENISHYFAAGVIKVDYTAAGFPDLMKIAKEWSKDANFHELIVRGVSEKNFGIQFVYYGQDLQEQAMKLYRQQLVDQFGKGVYATDYQEISSTDTQHIQAGVVTLRALSL